VKDRVSERPRPSEEALEAAAIANEWARRQPLRIRHQLFDLQPWVHRRRLDVVTADEDEMSPPPLVRLLQETGGQDAIRPKLLLSLYWVTTNQVEVFTNEPFEFWAYLLDLDEPDGKGARRVRESIARMGADEPGDPCSHLLDVRPKPPRPPRVGVLHEAGDGRPWVPPNPSEVGPTDYFLQLPPTFWTNGWMARLSGPALLAFLVTVSAAPFDAPPGAPVWISHERLEQHHRLNPKTWQAGLRELRSYELVTSRTSRVPTSSAYSTRVQLFVNLDVLNTLPPLLPTTSER